MSFQPSRALPTISRTRIRNIKTASTSTLIGALRNFSPNSFSSAWSDTPINREMTTLAKTPSWAVSGRAFWALARRSDICFPLETCRDI
jgi:hypothetical protein